jgi:hypothetical protein
MLCGCQMMTTYGQQPALGHNLRLGLQSPQFILGMGQSRLVQKGLAIDSRTLLKCIFIDKVLWLTNVVNRPYEDVEFSIKSPRSESKRSLST